MRGNRTRGYGGMRIAFRPAHADRPYRSRVSAQSASNTFRGNFPPATIDAVTGDDARGPASRDFPSGSIATLPIAWLLGVGIRAAHDTGRNWQLPWPQAGDRQPAVIPLSTRGAHRGPWPCDQAARPRAAEAASGASSLRRCIWTLTVPFRRRTGCGRDNSEHRLVETALVDLSRA